MQYFDYRARNLPAHQNGLIFQRFLAGYPVGCPVFFFLQKATKGKEISLMTSYGILFNCEESGMEYLRSIDMG